MAVLTTLKITGDPSRIEQALRSDPARLEAIAERAKGKGALRHLFYANADGSGGARRRRMGDRQTAEGF